MLRLFLDSADIDEIHFFWTLQISMRYATYTVS